MRLSEILEGKLQKAIPVSVPRNFVAKNAQTSGCGSHSDKKYSRKEKYQKSSDTKDPE